MKRSYQQPDPATVLAAIENEPGTRNAPEAKADRHNVGTHGSQATAG